MKLGSLASEALPLTTLLHCFGGPQLSSQNLPRGVDMKGELAQQKAQDRKSWCVASYGIYQGETNITYLFKRQKAAIYWFSPAPQQLGLDQAEARCWQLHPGLPDQ